MFDPAEMLSVIDRLSIEVCRLGEEISVLKGQSIGCGWVTGHGGGCGASGADPAATVKVATVNTPSLKNTEHAVSVGVAFEATTRRRRSRKRRRKRRRRRRQVVPTDTKVLDVVERASRGVLQGDVSPDSMFTPKVDNAVPPCILVTVNESVPNVDNGNHTSFENSLGTGEGGQKQCLVGGVNKGGTAVQDLETLSNFGF